MTERRSWPWAFLLLLSSLLVGCDGGAVSGTLAWDGTHVYERGDSVQGQLVVLSGEVAVQEGAQISGSVYILGARWKSGAILAET